MPGVRLVADNILRARTKTYGLLAQARYNYPHRLMFIAGMPKSGTEWLNAMLLALPGYTSMPFKDPKGLLGEHTLDEAVLRSCPKFGYYVFKTHVRATTETISAIENTELPTIVMWRDLRDQAISRYYHIINDPTHIHHNLYRTLSREDGVTHSVRISATEYADWIKNWMPHVEQGNGRFMLVRYEDLRADTDAQLVRALEFYGIEAPVADRAALLDRAAAVTKSGTNLADRLNRGVTYRAGRIGDWRAHFSQRDVDIFKELCGDLLVKLGYERDQSWSPGV